MGVLLLLHKLASKNRKMILSLYLISFLCVNQVIAETGVYCNAKDNDWKVCRTCNDVTKKCDEDPSGCYCENIEIQNPSTKNLTGGSDCKDGFCYVSQNSGCSDWVDGHDAFAYAGFDDLWNHQKVFRSTQACQSTIKIDTGNEPILTGVKIIGNFLHSVEVIQTGDTVKLDSTVKRPLVFYTETHEECMEECKSRCGICGAWSYDDFEGNCYLHTADACCGQKGKQERNIDWISGYICPICWSTGRGAECPCSLTQRLKGPTGCSAIAQNSGATVPQYKTPTGQLEVHTIKVKEDTCACIPKTIRRRRFGNRRICRKPICYDITLNPCGRCKDQRRCRNPRRMVKDTSC